MSTALRLLAALGLIAVNAAFVAAEFALVAVDRTRVEERASAGDRSARRIERLLSRLSFHLSGAQVGITVSSLLLGYLAEPTIAKAIDPLVEGVFGTAAPDGLSLILALAIATGTQMVLGELVPKTVATTKPYGTALAVAVPTEVYGVLVKPFVALMNSFSNGIVRALGVEPKEEIDTTPERDELQHMFESSGTEGALDEGEVQLLTRTIRLADKRADEAMVPRIEVAAISRDASVDELAALAIKTGHSRFPVIGENLDEVLGIVHVKALYRVPVGERATSRVAELMSGVLAVPESRDLDDLLDDLRGGNPGAAGQMAVVIDEHGGLAGIITLEDVLEEIVGEIDDEHDTKSPELTRPSALGLIVLPGSLHSDEVYETSGFRMPDGDYDTLAGLLLDRIERIPERGDSVDVDGWELKVVSMQGFRVVKIRLTPPEDDDSGDFNDGFDNDDFDATSIEADDDNDDNDGDNDDDGKSAGK